MKTLAAITLVMMLPSVSHGQNDLEKILRGVQQFQQMQQQQNQPPQEGEKGRMMAPVQGPNASGNQNRGDFNGNNFFTPGGSNFVQPGRNMNYPQNGNSFPGNRQYLNGQGNVTYPQNGMNGQGYPSGTIINGQPYQPGNMVNGQGYQPGSNYQPGQGYQPGQQYQPGQYQPGQYQPGQGQINTRISYPDPPIAPKKSYNGQPIVIRCADNATGICNYELVTESGKGFPYTISSGRSQQLQATTAWQFRYKPTPSAAPVSYLLRGGRTYEIRSNGNSWQLYMAP